MISKARIKFVRSLHQKKYRDEHSLFIAEGAKVITDILNSKYTVIEIFLVHELSLPTAFAQADLPVTLVSKDELNQLSNLSSSGGILAVFKMIPDEPKLPSVSDGLILALDDIRDPGNLGTIIRIADWFGIESIICSPACVEIYNPKVVQATMGSLARVNIYSVELEAVLKKAKRVFAAVLNGENIYNAQLDKRGIILIGNESRGISENLFPYITDKISIPKFSSGADSLNAAVATSVICSEFRRRKSKE